MINFIDFVIKRPFLTILLSVLLVGAAGVGFKNFTVETDYEVFFDGDNSRLNAHRQMEKEYGRKDGIRIGIEPKNGNVFDPRILGIIAEITKACWQIPFSNRVESLTNFQYSRDVDGDLVTSDLFSDPEQLTEVEFEKRKHFSLNDPGVVNLSVNPKGTVSGLVTYVTVPKGNPKVMREIYDASITMLNQFRAKYPDINFYLTGSVATNNAFFNASTKETGKLVLIMLVLGLFLTSFLLRTWSAILGNLVVVIGSTIIGLGVASWLSIPFTAFSSSSLIVIMAIVLSNTVHVISAMKKEIREGREPSHAIRSSLVKNLQPLFLGTLTTVIGLLCLNLSDVPPTRYLGTTAAFGVIGAYFLTYTLLPAILRILPIKAGSEPEGFSSKLWSWVADVVIYRKLTVFVGLLVISVGSISFISRNEVNDSILTYFDETVPFRSDTDYLVKNLFFFYSIDLSIPSGAENGINDPIYLAKVGQFVDWLKSQPEVYNVLTYTHIMKNLNRSMHDGDDQWYRLPEDRELSSQYMLLYEMSLPYGLDLNNQINADKSASKMIIGLYDLSSNQLKEFDRRIQRWMEANFPQSMQTVPSGPSLLFANIWTDAARGNLEGMIMAVVVISIIIGLAMRSLVLGFASLLPNLLPGLMAFGVWGLVSGRIDMGASVVSIISFGIVVDDTIHIMSKFRYAFFQLRYSAEQAVRYAITQVGEACAITSIVLVIGFGVLAQSSFHMTSGMGTLTCILLSFGLIMDLFLLPVMLIAIYKNRSNVMVNSVPFSTTQG